MYRHIEKDEKKLTDEEIVKALEHMANECKTSFSASVLDLIHRLQAEIERLTSLYEGQTAFMTSSIGDLPLTVEGLRKAVDEISRLLIVQTELQELNAKYYSEAKDLRRENAELQNQVDECENRVSAAYELGYKESKSSIVKGTAKEIYLWLKSRYPKLSFERYFIEKYGVEVE